MLAPASWSGVMVNTGQEDPFCPGCEVLLTQDLFQSGSCTNSPQPLSSCSVLWELLDYCLSPLLPGSSRKQPVSSGV